MNSKKFTFYLLLLIYAVGTVSCANYYTTRNILSEAMPEVLVAKEPRNCQIEVAQVTDKRPIEETKEFSQIKYRYFIPLLIWWQWETAGPVYANNQYYDADLTTNLQTLMSDTIEQSNICTGKGKRYILKTELHHYYGVRYVTNAAVITYGGGAAFGSSFFPTGFVGLKLSLVDGETSTEVATRYLSDSFLFNPEDEILSIDNAPTDNSTQVATLALKRAMAKLPKLVEQMLAYVDDESPSDLSLRTFTVIRLSPEYDFQEELVVEYATGRIVRNDMVKRSLPIISRPNEWVVAPMLDGRWLGPRQYQTMVQTLRKKYIVEFTQNITAANFYGIRVDGSAPVPRREYSPPQNLTTAPKREQQFFSFKSQQLPQRSFIQPLPKAQNIFSANNLWAGTHFSYRFIDNRHMVMTSLRNTDRVIQVAYSYDPNTKVLRYSSMGINTTLKLIDLTASRIVWKNTSGNQFVWIKQGFVNSNPQRSLGPLPSSRFYNPAEGLNDPDALELSKPGRD